MVSFRTEEGLPFVPVRFINEIFWSNLAKAQRLYPQRICNFMVEPNQIHMILLIDNPENAYKFIGYVKQETAHALNRLLGRRRKTVWVEDYDAPTILGFGESSPAPGAFKMVPGKNVTFNNQIFILPERLRRTPSGP